MNKIAVVAVAIAIIAIVVVSVFLIVPTVVKPTVTFKGWYQGGAQVATAKVNVPVTLKLEASSMTSGSLKVEIREDLANGDDLAVTSKTIELTSSENPKVVETSFTPTHKNGDTVKTTTKNILGQTVEVDGISKGYFYRLSWNGELFDNPEDRNSRNQLTVGEEAEGIPFTQTFEGWYQSGIKLTSPSPTHPEAKVNVPVTLKISVTNNGGDSFDGTIKIEIRKDIMATLFGNPNDKSFGFYPSTVSLGSGESKSINATFTPDEKTTGSLRGYFYKVYAGELAFYDPTSENGQGPDVRPELKVTEAGGPSGAISWQFPAKWSVSTNEGPQLTVALGSTVRAYAHVNNPNSVAVDVTIQMEIRRDKIDVDDDTKVTLTKTVSVASGVSFVDMGTFVSDEQTYSSGSGKLREYFMRVTVNGVRIWDPTSENGYGPDIREYVKVAPVAGQALIWTPDDKGKWEGAGSTDPQITVPLGTTVTAYAYVNNPNSVAVTVTIKMEVRRDIISGTDDVKATLTQTVSVDSGVSFVKMGTFVADEKTYDSGSGKLREYFMKVWFNGVLVHDPTDPNTREWVKTS